MPRKSRKASPFGITEPTWMHITVSARFFKRHSKLRWLWITIGIIGFFTLDKRTRLDRELDVFRQEIPVTPEIADVSFSFGLLSTASPLEEMYPVRDMAKMLKRHGANAFTVEYEYAPEL